MIFPAADLGKRDEVTFVIHMKDRFQVDHASDYSSGFGYTSATVKMEKVIYSKVMHDMQFIFL